MNPPKLFDGSRNKLREFQQDADLYMLVNDKIYDTDLKKIAFMLSFMTEGQAEAWADQFVEAAYTRATINKTTIDLGTFNQFKKDLNEAFKTYDSPGDALEQIKNLCMKNTDSLEEHLAKFKILLTKSKIDEASIVTINLFRETITIPLQSKFLPWKLFPKP